MAAVPVGLLLVGVGGVQHRQIPQGRADELGADGQAAPVEAAGHGQGGQARQVGGDGVDIAQVQAQRVGQALPQPGGGGGGHRGEEQVVPLEDRVKGGLQPGPGLEGFFVIGVVAVRGEDEGAQQNPLLHLRAEALGAGSAVQLLQTAAALRPPAVFHPVEPGQVGGGLGAGQDVVGGHRVVQQGQGALLHHRPPRPEHPGGGPDAISLSKLTTSASRE